MMSEPGFKTHLSDLRTLVDAALTAELSHATWPVHLKSAVEYSLMAGGKRLRPVLVLLANEVCGGRQEDAIPAACAIEMIHTYSLIHDDLPSMDDDDFRRGRATSHKVFGEALAILAGDCLLTMAFETIAAVNSTRDADGRKISEQIRILAVAAGGAGMVGGQVLDLEAERSPFATAESSIQTQGNGKNQGCDQDSSTVDPAADFAEPDAIQSVSSPTIEKSGKNVSNQSVETRVVELSQIHKMKTGALIAGALELGAASANADEHSRKQLRHYGHCIGLAFQIADDLLDVIGDQSKLGKKPGRDADLGKLTYPGLLGIENSRAKAEQLVQEACDAISDFGDRSRWLTELARFIVERDH